MRAQPLTNDDIRFIRQSRAKIQVLARHFGQSTKTITQIQECLIYTHLARDITMRKQRIETLLKGQSIAVNKVYEALSCDTLMTPSDVIAQLAKMGKGAQDVRSVTSALHKLVEIKVAKEKGGTFYAVKATIAPETPQEAAPAPAPALQQPTTKATPREAALKQLGNLDGATQDIKGGVADIRSLLDDVDATLETIGERCATLDHVAAQLLVLLDDLGMSEADKQKLAQLQQLQAILKGVM